MADTTNLDTTPVCIQNASYTEISLDGLLKPLDGFQRFISSGDTVVLKVNLLNASTADSAVVTHPSIVAAVAQAVLDVGGIPVIGDSPAGRFSQRRLKAVYKSSGLDKVAREVGAELNWDTRVTSVDVVNGRRLKKTQVCSFIAEADTVVALPKLKAHSYMILTLAMKIMYGALPGLLKARYHSQYIRRETFSDMLCDVLSVVPADLYILDGVVGMHQEGPSGGDPIDIGVVMASTDPVSMDLSVCKMLGIEPVGIPILKRAKIRGLWPETISYPLLSPEEVRFDGFQLPSTAGHLLTGKKTPSKYPVPSENCIACGLCEEICPVSAITIPDKIALVEYSKCIRCYCCHEVCPYKAIELQKR